MAKKHALTVTSLDLTVLATFVAVFKPYLIPDNLQNILKIGLLICVILFLLLHLKLRKFVNASLILVVPIMLSCIYNYIQQGSSRQEFLNGILYAICLYSLYTILLYWTQIGKFNKVIRDVYYILWVYCIISIISIVILGQTTTYFFGSKYYTSYYFIFFIGLYYFQNKKKISNNIINQIEYLLLAVILTIFIWYIDCITGLVGMLAVIVLSFFPERIREVISNPWVVIIAVIGSLLLLFVIANIMQIEFVQNIIVNILRRSPNLTDRLRYYARALNVLQSSNVLVGYGYSTEALRTAIGLGSNIQNGFMQYILNYGLIGGITCLITIYRSVNRKSIKVGENWGLYMVIYALIVCAIVEVSFNTIFFFSLFLLYWSIYDSRVFVYKNRALE